MSTAVERRFSSTSDRHEEFWIVHVREVEGSLVLHIRPYYY